jgi:CYTH domain-containing protein
MAMDNEELKYSRIEYERRFLVSLDFDWQTLVAPYSKTFEDKYLENSRLRLRKLTDSDSDRIIIKLTKKFESDSPYYQKLNRILLSAEEYQLFNSLKGYQIKKTRYYHHDNDVVYSIDVFEGELKGLVLCEIEADGLEELISAAPPVYARREVTADPFFTGGNLCKITNAQLLDKLAAIFK